MTWLRLPMMLLLAFAGSVAIALVAFGLVVLLMWLAGQ